MTHTLLRRSLTSWHRTFDESANRNKNARDRRRGLVAAIAPDPVHSSMTERSIAGCSAKNAKRRLMSKAKVRPISLDGAPSVSFSRSATSRNGGRQVNSTLFCCMVQFDMTVLSNRRFFAIDASLYKEYALPASSTHFRNSSDTEARF